jgi:hypothetical protein
VKVTGLDRFAGEAALDEATSGADESDNDDTNGVDEEVLEEHNFASREEPECWEEYAL